MKKPKPPKVRQPPQTSPTVATSVTHVRQQWAGPLPPPAVLQQFDAIVSGGAERIMRMAEKEQDHRIRMETQGQIDGRAHTTRGHYLGAGLSIVAIGASAVTALSGAHWAVSVALVGIPLMAVIRAILVRRVPKS